MYCSANNMLPAMKEDIILRRTYIISPHIILAIIIAPKLQLTCNMLGVLLSYSWSVIYHFARVSFLFDSNPVHTSPTTSFLHCRCRLTGIRSLSFTLQCPPLITFTRHKNTHLREDLLSLFHLPRIFSLLRSCRHND